MAFSAGRRSRPGTEDHRVGDGRRRRKGRRRRHAHHHAPEAARLMLADVRLIHSGRAMIAHLSGEVDISNADKLRTAITEATPNQSLALVFDLSEIDYLDSAGIQLIYQLRADLRARGQSLRLVIPASSPATD